MTENGDGGFRLIGSSKNRIAGSTISGASDSGVGLEGLSSYNRLVRNKVTLAGEGVKVDDGTGNRVFRNTLSHNGGAGVGGRLGGPQHPHQREQDPLQRGGRNLR